MPCATEKLEKHKKKHKSLLAKWSDLDESEDDSGPTEVDEEESNLCLMASSEVNSEFETDMSDNEMYAEMQKLLKALKKADVKINMLDTENKALKNEKDALKQTNMLLVDENDILKMDNETLHIDNDSLRMAKENLEKENHVLKEETKDLKAWIENLSQTIDNTFNKFKKAIRSCKCLYLVNRMKILNWLRK